MINPRFQKSVVLIAKNIVVFVKIGHVILFSIVLNLYVKSVPKMDMRDACVPIWGKMSKRRTKTMKKT